MNRPANVLTLKAALAEAERVGCALGSFSCRYTPMIEPILRAGQAANSPLIVQMSQRELGLYGVEPREVAEEFYAQLERQQITVPVVLHLDHTRKFEIIQAAIEAGFTSVMIDASEKPFNENVDVSREVVDYAHGFGVSVEAELGMIGTTDFVETEHDEELFTDPGQAKIFVDQTCIDALAVSVGTAHGVYNVRKPRVDYDRLQRIRALTPVHLVLHGGSGVPPEMMQGAIHLPGGGVSKVNIATDLELSLLEALGRTERMTNAECKALPPDQLQKGRDAVAATVRDKMDNFLGSSGYGSQFRLA
jgi:ketose-bisphosphate aldolase